MLGLGSQRFNTLEEASSRASSLESTLRRLKKEQSRRTYLGRINGEEEPIFVDGGSMISAESKNFCETRQLENIPQEVGGTVRGFGGLSAQIGKIVTTLELTNLQVRNFTSSQALWWNRRPLPTSTNTYTT